MGWIRNLMNRLFTKKLEVGKEIENGVINGNNKLESTLEKYEVPETPMYLPKLETLEYAVEQWLYKLIDIKNKNQSITAYNALTSLGTFDDIEISGNNPQNEMRLLDEIEYNPNLLLHTQRSKNIYDENGDKLPMYYHVKKGNPYGCMWRIYLNCKRENVAVLADELMKELDKDEEYYIKFDSDVAMSKKSRMEKIVIYIPNDDDQLNSKINAVQRVEQKYPQLFEGKKATNPFLQLIGENIMYAYEPTSSYYKDLEGENLDVGVSSYNDLLSYALEDSYVNAIRNVVSKDQNLLQKIGYANNMDFLAYTNLVLEDIIDNSEKKQDLIIGISNNLEKCQENNPVLGIRGITEEERTERDI